MIVTSDGFVFDFPNAVTAFKFDEGCRSCSYYHGVSHALKAVDVVAEFHDYYLFIETKDFFNPVCPDTDVAVNEKALTSVLVQKYRDSLLYRFAEQKTDKPVKYLCLLMNLENAFCVHLTNELRKRLPVGNARPERWVRELAAECVAFNRLQQFPFGTIRRV